MKNILIFYHEFLENVLDFKFTKVLICKRNKKRNPE